MAQTKVTYDVREVTEVDAAKITTGTIPEARITSLAASKLTGTVDNARISLDAAEIPDLAASKITSGTIDNARISLDAAEIPDLDTAKITTGELAPARMGTGTASSSTVLYGDGTYKAEPVTDTTSIKNDISLLALQTAINGNMSAYGLKNSWIEQFENSTYIENLSSTARVTSDEYVASVYAADVVTTPASDSDWSGEPSYFTNGSGTVDVVTGDHAQKSDWVSGTGDFTVKFTMVASANFCWGMYKISEDGSYTDGHAAGMQNMTDSYWWSDSTNPFTGSGSPGRDVTWKGSTSQSATHPADGSVVKVKRVGSTITFIDDGVTYSTYTSVSTASYRVVVCSGGAPTGEWSNTTFTAVSSQDNATGSFNSTDVVPQDATNKSSVGLVVLYKDQAGTNTLNTDIVAKVRANTGQAYQTLVLAGAGTYSDSLKIAIAPAIAVTAGQALSYQISFANQSSSSKEARIYGIAMTYQEI